MIGETILHYKILEKLGEGGMGVVYLAEDTKLKRQVAIKFLPHHISSNEEERKRFEIEAQAAAALNHPNIATIHGLEESDDKLFIVMEYIKGIELKEKIKSGPIQVNEAINIAIQIAEGLNAAHKRGIIHRDIKSSNIMVTGSGIVTIMDFGLAKIGDSTQVTKIGTTVGTVAYMSPEQAMGGELDNRSDIWSFGVVLYEMLTGQLPFNGNYEQAILYSIMNEEPKTPTELRKGLPEFLMKILQKTMEKNKNKRYQNFSEILENLKEITAKKASILSSETELESNPSIAVLPFTNMSADQENEYFSEGLCEEIINALTKIKDLKVAARTSSFSFKGKTADIQEIGKKLNVENILEGSVRRSGNRLRITAQLIKAGDGYHLWSERYDRVMDDIFAIQDEITLAIVDKLKIELIGEEKRALVARHTNNLEAYQLYLKGRFYRYTKNDIKSALPYFRQAVELDPSHVPSRVGLAEIYVLQSFYGYARPHDAYKRARTELDAAFKIQPDSPEALTVDAFNRMCYDRNWNLVEQRLKKAIELNPANVHSYAWYGDLLSVLGRNDESMVCMEKAQKLDPLSSYPYGMTGLVLLNNGKVEQAAATFEKAIRIDPENLLGQWGFGAALVALDRGDEAVKVLERVLVLSGRAMFFLGLFGWALAADDRIDEAKKILTELNARSGNEYKTLISVAWLFGELGETDKAWELLFKAEEERQPLGIFLGLPGYDRLHKDKRFELLKKRMHLQS